MKPMGGETEVGLWIGVIRQGRDTNTRYQRYQSARNANAEECDTERVGMQIPNATR
jgi:hypothetical protein